MKQNLLNSLLLLFVPLIAFTQDSLLTEQLRPHVHLIKLENGELSGAGFDFLKKEAQQTPFFLIGEAHGFREIPLFTASLFSALKAYDYRYFATETGPFAAETLTKFASRKDWKKDYTAFLQAYPWTFPFYGWQEETEILDVVLSQAPPKEAVIWGLDQEFAAGYRNNFKQLVEAAANQKSRQVAQEYYDKAMKAYEASFADRNPQASFLAVVKPEDFSRLKEAFAGQTMAQKRILEMEESTRIYQLWYQREGLQSNALRAELMKRHFFEYYTKAKKQNPNPKVLFKFGANHMYRGANTLHVYDIGNFVSELASQQGKQSFHLYVLGVEGFQNTFSPFSTDEADKQRKYDVTLSDTSIDYSPILSAAATQSWSVLDLRPLRKAIFNRTLTIVDPKIEKIIWSYDAILVIPQINASTNFD